ncbi:MAG: hypothetical protein HLUCCA04_00275 [Oceanicaulis sp. HLUCCA04]|nr:MAG: hypothetical protein HLUCCA04_00275 [Oceanicaulis sp. HLUCCA04]
MTSSPNPHARRYMLHMFLAMAGYCAVLFASLTLIRGDAVDADWLRIIIAISPVIPALYGLHAMIVFVRSMDEFNRAVIAEATMISAGAVAFLSFAYAFAQQASDLLPEIGLIWVLPAIVGGQGLAACFVRRRYA